MINSRKNSFDIKPQEIQGPTIGILRENQSAWERRVALIPLHCKQLIKEGIKVIIQPSKIRCYSDDEYISIGCEIKEDLKECNLLLGIQNPDINTLLNDRTYMFFSHTKKGKTENRDLLEKLLEKRIRLIDYECIKEDLDDRSKAKRLVSFGRIAGIAGTINLLKGIGQLLLTRQISTPFVFTKLAYMYSDVESAKKSLNTLGVYLQEQYLPEELSPFIIAIIGNGQVSKGVQEAIKCLPHKFLSPRELLEQTFEKKRDTIYAVVFNLEDLFEQKDSNVPFDKTKFIKSPELFKCTFNTKYLKYCHAIIYCLYWESRYPRILTKLDIKNHFAKESHKLIGIADITCDLNGGIELLNRYTKFRDPFFIYEPIIEKEEINCDHSTTEGIIYSAIPNLAASFSEDASNYFSHLLFPYIEKIALSEYPQKFDKQRDITNEVKNAVICSGGILTPIFKNIFRNMEDKQKMDALIPHLNVKNFSVSIKMKGHIFDKGLFRFICNSFALETFSHKINFLSIGDGSDLPSIVYVEVYTKTKEELKIFMENLRKKSEENEIELEILKSNIV